MHRDDDNNKTDMTYCMAIAYNSFVICLNVARAWKDLFLRPRDL